MIQTLACFHTWNYKITDLALWDGERFFYALLKRRQVRRASCAKWPNFVQIIPIPPPHTHTHFTANITKIDKVIMVAAVLDGLFSWYLIPMMRTRKVCVCVRAYVHKHKQSKFAQLMAKILLGFYMHASGISEVAMINYSCLVRSLLLLFNPGHVKRSMTRTQLALLQLAITKCIIPLACVMLFYSVWLFAYHRWILQTQFHKTNLFLLAFI